MFNCQGKLCNGEHSYRAEVSISIFKNYTQKDFLIFFIGVDKTSDAELDAFIREKGDSAYHPSCTCKMGDPNDPMAVVGPDTKVLGQLFSKSDFS